MFLKSQITMDSPRPIREILTTLARMAGEREDYARVASRVPDRGTYAATTNADRARANTAWHLLTAAWVAAGCDEDGRMWIPIEDAERLADAMIQIVVLQRHAPDLASSMNLDLDGIFAGRIELSPNEVR